MEVNSIITGIFKEEAQAESTIIVLRSVGFHDDQILYIGHKVEKNTNRIFEYLLSIGLQEEEVSYYRSEMEIGRSIVLVMHGGRRAEALNILFLNSTRRHQYLKFGTSTGDNVTVPFQSELNDQDEDSQSFSTDISSNTSFPSLATNQTSEQDEIASVYQLLKDVDLDYLL